MILHHRFFLPLFFLFLLSFSSCRFNPADGLSWDTDLLAPIAYSSVGIGDVVQDSSVLTVDANNLLSLVVRDTIANTALGDLVEFPDTSIDLGIKLDTLNLDSDTISQFITLADIARQLADSNPLLSQILLQSHGDTLPFVPATPGLSSDTIEIDASEFFEFADLKSGELVLTINNQLPVDISNVVVWIANESEAGSNQLISDTYALIPSRTQLAKTYDLAGKQVESTLQGQLENLDIESGTNVPIDTSDFIEISIVAQNMRAKTATAIFPAQTIIDSVRTTEYKPTGSANGDFSDIELTKIRVKSGRIEATTVSTVEDTVQFQYSLPSAINSMGNVPAVNFKLNPALPGQTTTQTETATLDGFIVDLTAGGTTFNTIEERIKVDLLYSGKLVTLDDQDSISVSFGLLDIVPTYVEGYIGQARFEFSGKEALDIFNDFTFGKLKFNQPRAEITFANSVGVDAQVNVKDFSGINSQTGESTQLSGSALIAGPVTIQGPSLPDTNKLELTTIAFDTDNSNIKTFVNILADEITYDLELVTNHNGKSGVWDNFATENSQLLAYVDFELPLDGIVESLILEDSTALDLNEIDLGEVQGGSLKLILENEFPLQARLLATVYDENDQVVTVLANNHIIEAGQVAANGIVDVPGTSILEIAYNDDLVTKLVDQGHTLVFHYSIDTRPDNEPVKLFADYRINAKLVAAFTYRLSN